MKNKIKNIMIKLKTLFFLLLFSAVTFAQENYTQRIIFLWDVTYSMHGGYCGGKNAKSAQVNIAGQMYSIQRYSEKYDIYTDAMDMLVSYIGSFYGDTTELVVIPFGSKVVDGAWRAPATVDGKAFLINKIKGFCELRDTVVGKTNISAALEYAEYNVLDKDDSTSLYLMTDGIDNVNRNKFLTCLKRWCTYPNVEGYYFALTDNALDSKLKTYLVDSTCFHLTTGLPPIPPKCQKSIQSSVTHSVADDRGKPVRLMVRHEGGPGLDQNASVHFMINDNPYLLLDTVVVLTPSIDLVELYPTYSEVVSTISPSSPVCVNVLFEKMTDDQSNLMLYNNSSSIILTNRELIQVVISMED